MKQDAGFHAFGYTSAIGPNPFLLDTHCQYFSQTIASRVQTRCLHTNKPINRSVIPMTHYILVSACRQITPTDSHHPRILYFAILVMYSASHKYIQYKERTCQHFCKKKKSLGLFNTNYSFVRTDQQTR